MPFSFRTAAAAAALAVVGTGLVVTTPAGAHTTGIHDKCTNLNKRSNKIYWAAERHNSDLDRDNDRITCEKA
jgi:hypothetical protein